MSSKQVFSAAAFGIFGAGWLMVELALVVGFVWVLFIKPEPGPTS